MSDAAAAGGAGPALARFIEEAAQQLADALGASTRAHVRPAVAEARRGARELLREAFVRCEQLRGSDEGGEAEALPDPAALTTRRAVDALLQRLEGTRAVLQYRPWADALGTGDASGGFYQGDRLGVIRRIEPVRIRFFHDTLLPAADPRRFEIVERFVRQVRWFLERLDQADALEPKADDTPPPPPAVYEWEELLYGSSRD